MNTEQHRWGGAAEGGGGARIGQRIGLQLGAFIAAFSLPLLPAAAQVERVAVKVEEARCFS